MILQGIIGIYSHQKKGAELMDVQKTVSTIPGMIFVSLGFHLKHLKDKLSYFTGLIMLLAFFMIITLSLSPKL